jgi:hypothetical protein
MKASDDSVLVRSSARHGLTLMEMLFAIAILMVGMVGIASVLGLAGRNAVRSKTLAESQAVANAAYETFLAYDMNRMSNWDPFVNWGYRGVWIDPIGSFVSPIHNFGNDNNGTILRVAVRTKNGAVVSQKLAEKIFRCEDDPAVQKDGDSTLHVSRRFESLADGSIARSTSQQLYSWFAILLINQRPSNRGLVSIVVVKNRDFVAPPTQVSVRPVSGSFDTEISSALRVIIDNVPTDYKIKSGDWIMLSTPINITNQANFDSWYRILSVSSEPVQGTGSFSATLAGRALPAGTTNVFGTMLEGVVCVHERAVDILP